LYTKAYQQTFVVINQITNNGMNLKFLLIFLVFFSAKAIAQKPTQTLRGIVLDIASNHPIVLANVSISSLQVGTTTYSLGNFTLQHIQLRHRCLIRNTKEEIKYGEILALTETMFSIF
jgi:hypothetical protein